MLLRTLRGFGFARGCGGRTRPERFEESFLEIVTVFEIRAGVGVGFIEQTGFNHVEDDLAKIVGSPNAPFVKQGEGHRTVLSESVITNPIEEFLAAHVPELLFLFFADFFLGMIEGLAHEQISVAVITRIFGRDFFEDFFEMDRLHKFKAWTRLRWARAGAPDDTI